MITAFQKRRTYLFLKVLEVVTKPTLLFHSTRVWLEQGHLLKVFSQELKLHLPVTALFLRHRALQNTLSSCLLFMIVFGVLDDP